jgi:hypothetical protein
MLTVPISCEGGTPNYDLGYAFTTTGAPDDPVMVANALVMAAGRELLDACIELVEAMHRYAMDVEEPAPFKHRDMMDRAKAAIAKARPA